MDQFHFLYEIISRWFFSVVWTTFFLSVQSMNLYSFKIPKKNNPHWKKNAHTSVCLSGHLYLCTSLRLWLFLSTAPCFVILSFTIGPAAFNVLRDWVFVCNQMMRSRKNKPFCIFWTYLGCVSTGLWVCKIFVHKQKLCIRYSYPTLWFVSQLYKYLDNEK